MAQLPAQSDQNFYHSQLDTRMHRHLYPDMYREHLSPLRKPASSQFRSSLDLVRFWWNRAYNESADDINAFYNRPKKLNHAQNFGDSGHISSLRRTRRSRTTFTYLQTEQLEHCFQQFRYLTNEQLANLAAKLAIGTPQVRIWFKNRRRRFKLQYSKQKKYSSRSSNKSDIEKIALNISSSLPSQSIAIIEQLKKDSPFPSYMYGNNLPLQTNSLTNLSSFLPCSPRTTNPTPTDSVIANLFAPPPIALPQHNLHQQLTQQESANLSEHLYGFLHKAPNDYGHGQRKDSSWNEMQSDYNLNISYSIPEGLKIAVINDDSSELFTTNTTNEAPVPMSLDPDYAKHDDSLDMCSNSSDSSNFSSSDATQKMDDTVLAPSFAFGSSSENNDNTLFFNEECTDIFSKFMNRSSSPHNKSFHCTMDTLIETFSHHPNSASSTQFVLNSH